ncbi:MAG: extracellular solute-binding protein [Chloroflexi bacterium]|nr:extracellular solute-binding protein [Chloroflexota bacterium]
MRPLGRRAVLQAGLGALVAGLAHGTRAFAQSSGAGPSATPDRTTSVTAGPEEPALASAAPTPRPQPGELRLLTAPDHWDPGVIVAIAAEHGIAVRVTPLVDDAAAHAAVVDGSVTPDLVTADGGWVTRYRLEDRVAPLDLGTSHVVEELFPVARTMDLVAGPDGLMGFPWSWSPLQVVYDPSRVARSPASWDVLLEPRHRRSVVVEAQRLDLVLCAARAVGARDPLAMTDAELDRATEWLTRLAPNVRRVVRQRSDAIRLLATGECALAISALGAPDLVRDAAGPELVAFVPKEGTIGSIEVEVLLRDAPNAARVPAWLEMATAPEVAAESFLRDGRPLFNERALRLLMDTGHGDRARRYLYDRPEIALSMTLTGPGIRPDDYLAAYRTAFAEVPGA